MGDLDKKIRERAYSIWESEGREHGRDKDHWDRAEAELQGEHAAPSQSIPDRDTINREPAASQDGVSTQGQPTAENGKSDQAGEP